MNLIDNFNRKISHFRVSVTDRCDLRCQYCMNERMKFLPKEQILTFEEIERLCDNFIELGVNKIRLTGGEPLVRKNILHLINNLGSKIGKSKFVSASLDFIFIFSKYVPSSLLITSQAKF